jgi:large subunit ribosomal protein L25
MADIAIAAATRSEKGKGPVRRLRLRKMIPAVLYGEQKEPLSLKLPEIDIERLLNRGASHSILNLQIDGSTEKNLAMIKEIQHTTLTSKIQHIDLIRISLDRKVEVRIEIKLVNTDGISKKGGIINQIMNELNVECYPDKIPETIDLDLVDAGPGDSFNVADLKAPEGVVFLDEADEVIVAVLAQKAEEVLPAAAEGEAVEGEAAEGEAAEGADAKAKDAKAKDAKGADAKGKDAKGADAKGKDMKGKDAKGKEG